MVRRHGMCTSRGTASTSRFSTGGAGKGACMLPGVDLKFSAFIPEMWRAVVRGFVQHGPATFVYEGLRWGFQAGFNASNMHGHRSFKNYPTGLGDLGREGVAKATMKRLAAEKTIDLRCLGSNARRCGKTDVCQVGHFPIRGCGETSGAE